jgi:hypothetical protein
LGYGLEEKVDEGEKKSTNRQSLLCDPG